MPQPQMHKGHSPLMWAGQMPKLELFTSLIRTAMEENKFILEESLEGMQLAAGAFFRSGTVSGHAGAQAGTASSVQVWQRLLARVDVHLPASGNQASLSGQSGRALLCTGMQPYSATAALQEEPEPDRQQPCGWTKLSLLLALRCLHAISGTASRVVQCALELASVTSACWSPRWSPSRPPHALAAQHRPHSVSARDHARASAVVSGTGYQAWNRTRNRGPWCCCCCLHQLSLTCALQRSGGGDQGGAAAGLLPP